MNLRMDKDEVIYIDNPKSNDLFVIFKTLDGKWQLESRRFGPIKTFSNQIKACIYCREQVN